MASEVVMGVRLERQLRDAFLAACEANDVTGSQILRAVVREYVAKNAQGVRPLKTEKPKRTRKG